MQLLDDLGHAVEGLHLQVLDALLDTLLDTRVLVLRIEIHALRILADFLDELIFDD